MIRQSKGLKANVFVDKRIGENAELTHEEKMYKRLEKARKSKLKRVNYESSRQRKKNIYNIDEDVLTHGGVAIGDDYTPDLREMAGLEAAAEFDLVAKKGRKGKGKQKDDLHKTIHVDEKEILKMLGIEKGEDDENMANLEERAEYMEYLKEKNQRKVLKEMQEDLREELDDEYTNMVGLLKFKEKKQKKSKRDFLADLLAGKRNLDWGDDSVQDKKEEIAGGYEELDEYETMILDLEYEKRAVALSRTKTDEEIAKAQKEKLEKLEKERVNRMYNVEEDEQEEGDDLTYEFDDDFREDGDEGESESESESESEEDDESSTEIAKKEDNKPDEEEEEEEEEGIVSKTINKEIPFVFGCPKSLEELVELFELYATNCHDINIIIERILKCNNVKLAAENKEKMNVFYNILVTRMIKLGDELSKEGRGGEMNRLVQMNFLTQTLYDLTHQLPLAAASVWRRTLSSMQAKLMRKSTELSQNLDVSTWPSMGHLYILRVLPLLFPSTDLRHVIMTPAKLLLGQYIAHSPITKPNHIVKALFCTTLMLQYNEGSDAKYYSPEAFAFLVSIIPHFTKESFKLMKDSIPLPSLASTHLSFLTKWEDYNIPEKKKRYPILLRSAPKTSSTLFPCFVSTIFDTMLSLIKTYYELLDSKLPLPEMSLILIRSLLSIKSLHEDSNLNLVTKLEQLIDFLIINSQKHINEFRNKPFNIYALSGETKVKAPKVISLVPRIEEKTKFSKDKDYDENKAETKRLMRAIRNQKKAILKGIRTESTKTLQKQEKLKVIKEESRKRKRVANLSWLEDQQAAVNKAIRLVGNSSIKGGGSRRKKMKR